MKILYLTDINLNNKGGGGTHVRELVKGLSKRKYNFYLVSNSDYKNVGFNFSALKNVIKGPDVDLIYARQSGSLFIHFILSKILSAPLITEVNGAIEEEMRSHKVSELKIKIAKIIEMISYNLSDRIITNSEGLKEYLVRKYKINPFKIKVIGMGVDATKFKKTKLKKKSITVGYIGSLSHWQGLEYLIGSAKIVSKKNKFIQFYIVGDGPEKDSLMKLVKKLKMQEYITFEKAVSHFHIPKKINSFDICICCLTRFKEGLYGPPIKVFEYLACEKPVIMSDIKGVTDLFKKNTLILSEPEDSQDLAQKILFLARNRSLWQKLGKNGRKFVIDNYSWGSIAKKTEEVIQEVIAEKEQKPHLQKWRK